MRRKQAVDVHDEAGKELSNEERCLDAAGFLVLLGILSAQAIEHGGEIFEFRLTE